MRLVLILALAAPLPAAADIVLAARTIRAQEIIMPGDLVSGEGQIPGAYTDPAPLYGLEARAVLYAGRPVRQGDLRPAARVERNQIVTLRFAGTALMISAEGRALDRAAVGETIRVMNTASRATITGRVQPDGSVNVLQ